MDIIQLLQNEYSRRRMKNPSYSFRAFAQSLDIPSGRLSELLNGKRRITPAHIERILQRIPVEVSNQLVDEKQDRPLEDTSQNMLDVYYLVKDDAFHVISDWHHFAILNLANTADFRNDVEWMAERLETKAALVRMALDRLLRTGLLKQTGDKIAPTYFNVKSTDQVINPALRLAHTSALEKAIVALENVDIEKRDCSSMGMAIDMSKLSEARKLIRKFRRSMVRLMETGNKTEVYNLNIQFVPVTKLKDEKSL